MNAKKIVAIVLIAAGALGLIYRGFTYTSESHQANVGSLQFSVSKKDRIEVPVWASACVLVIGVVVLISASRS
ncbi:MAG TPA: hypothetical protein VMG11_04280 [Steroidobacteraceae bacterium]|nr:hypothetical protein [Steroidobacteraceae bacterium]